MSPRVFGSGRRISSTRLPRDELGGITVENEGSFANGGYQFPEGKLRLNGEETLAYARYARRLHGTTTP